jgi:CubicO group peptidase (beta-lactamase class C family)
MEGQMRLLPVALCAVLAASFVSTFYVWAEPISVATVPDKLAGLWKAKKRFGPDARGRLVISRERSGLVADIAGVRLPVSFARGELSFALPNGKGSFRGKFSERAVIVGQWYAPPNQAAFAGAVYVSPARLRAVSPHEWRGEIDPLEDTFSFFLLLRKTSDGSLSAVLRNPERDLGTQQGADRMAVDGSSVDLMGRRGNQSAEKVLAHGTYDKERDELELTFPDRGGAYDFVRDSDESDFYPRAGLPVPYTYRAPVSENDGWQTASLMNERIDAPAIERFIRTMTAEPMDRNSARQLHAILIARHGKLVLEEYFHGFSRDALHETRSAAKSVTSVIVGAAMSSGIPLTLASPVYQVMNGGQLPADLDPEKRSMTLQHLLTMSSGLYCDDNDPKAPGNEDNMNDQTGEPDYYRYTLAVPQATPPGQKAVYCSAGANLALGMVGRAAKENPLYIFDRLVARPMQIARYAWPLDPAGNPYGGGSVQLLPRDFLKFGQLLLDGGVWRGKRVLDAAYVKLATTPHFHLANIGYGYLWWCNSVPYKNRMVRIFSALGAGGQAVTVVPELDLVVAMFSGNYSSGTAIDTTHNLLPKYILPAVREPGDDLNAPVPILDYKTSYGLSPDGSPIR